MLAYLALVDALLPSPDLAPFETEFRAAVRKAVCETLVAPITSGANAFAKAALFHPDICRLLQHGGLDEHVFRLCVESVREDVAALSGEGTAVTKLSCIIFDTYLEECKLRDAAVFLGFAMLKKSGLYDTTDAMSYWRTIANETGNPFHSLLPVVPCYWRYRLASRTMSSCSRQVGAC